MLAGTVAFLISGPIGRIYTSQPAHPRLIHPTDAEWSHLRKGEIAGTSKQEKKEDEDLLAEVVAPSGVEPEIPLEPYLCRSARDDVNVFRLHAPRHAPP